MLLKAGSRKIKSRFLGGYTDTPIAVKWCIKKNKRQLNGAAGDE
jgi:hypothetical protein